MRLVEPDEVSKPSLLPEYHSDVESALFSRSRLLMHRLLASLSRHSYHLLLLVYNHGRSYGTRRRGDNLDVRLNEYLALVLTMTSASGLMLLLDLPGLFLFDAERLGA